MFEQACKNVQRLVLVGDHKQLPATLMSEPARRCGYGRSLLERLAEAGRPVSLLNTQYR